MSITMMYMFSTAQAILAVVCIHCALNVSLLATGTIGSTTEIFAPPSSSDHDLAVLWNRTMSSMLPNAENAASAVAAARKVAETLREDGSWPDINYADVSQGGHDQWQPAAHLSRLVTMTGPLVACHLPKEINPLCNSTTLASGVDAALKFWLVRNPCSENWFFNQISSPGELASALLMLKQGGRLDGDTLALADIDVRRGADFWEGWSGMNLVDMATLQIYRGLLFGNTSLVAEGFSAVWGQLAIMQWPAPTPSATRAARCNSSAAASTPCIPDSCQVGGGTYLGDGIQADDSFHQHGAQLEDGSYVYTRSRLVLPVEQDIEQ